jgi:hypothetical protein
MTIFLGICGAINVAIIVLGIPSALWGKKPIGSGGLIWWLTVTLFIATFGAVSFVAELALATSDSNIARFVLVVALVVIVSMFFGRGKPSHA